MLRIDSRRLAELVKCKRMKKAVLDEGTIWKIWKMCGERFDGWTKDWEKWKRHGERRHGWTKIGKFGKVVENVAIDGQRTGMFGKVSAERNLKRVVMDGV